MSSNQCQARPFARRMAVAAALLFTSGAPSADVVSCQNDGEGQTKDSRFAFCSRRQCVECVGRGRCGGHPCVDGRCEILCKDGRDGSADRACVDGTCRLSDQKN